jgi:hypothetical protein
MTKLGNQTVLFDGNPPMEKGLTYAHTCKFVVSKIDDSQNETWKLEYDIFTMVVH